MKRIDSTEDDKRGVITYELSDGQWVTLDARAVREIGAVTLLRRMKLGHLLPTERVPVMQYGRRVGTLPPDFDPLLARSNSFLFDYRPGDLRREGNAWIARRTLGASDLDCLVGFVRESAHEQSEKS